MTEFELRVQEGERTTSFHRSLEISIRPADNESTDVSMVAFVTGRGNLAIRIDFTAEAEIVNNADGTRSLWIRYDKDRQLIERSRV